MDEVTAVDVSNELFAAMVFLAAVAYPEDWKGRDDFIVGMKAYCARFSINHGRARRSTLSSMLKMPKQQQNGRMRLGINRLLQRTQMAEVFAPALIEAIQDGPLRIAIKITDPETNRELKTITQKNWCSSR